ncbi:hypothetical protein BH09ACT7_BH09ACT7_24990 [soil metagenome]
MGVAASVAGLTIAQPLATTAVPLVMAALIVESNSATHSGDSGIGSFFNRKFLQDGPSAYVGFLTGPFGIWQALTRHPDEQDYNPDSVLAAAGRGPATSGLPAPNLPVISPPPLQAPWVLDDNVATADGAPGAGNPVVDPILQPTTPDVPQISSAYEYDIVGNAPKYLLNPFAAANSLVAALDRRSTQPDLQLPVTDDGTVDCTSGGMSCTYDGDAIYVTYVDENQNIVSARVERINGITYVSYESPDGLPLVRPLRELGEPGNALADALEPALTALVDYGYANNDPLSQPGGPQEIGLLPTISETRAFVHNFVNGIRQGAESLVDPEPAHGTLRAKSAALAKPIVNEIRESLKFSPGGTTAGRANPPKPVAISVKTAVDKLTRAFAPKSGDAAPARAKAGARSHAGKASASGAS